MTIKLHIIIKSSNKGRAILPIAEWLESVVRKDKRYQIKVVDITNFDLPNIAPQEIDEDLLPMADHPGRLKWAHSVNDAEAFIFIVSGRNRSDLTAIEHAIHFLDKEWFYKPAAFVSYGGITGGVQAALSLMPKLMELKMHPIPEIVSIPLVQQYVKDGHLKSLFFEAQETHEHTAKNILNELHQWSGALKHIRLPSPSHREISEQDYLPQLIGE